MKIETINLDDLKLYEDNAKRHPKKQIEHIKQSIKDHNYNIPITIDENNMILCGHGRYQALKELGYKKVDVIRLTHFKNMEEKIAFMVAENHTNMETGFDDDKLYKNLTDIGKAIDMSSYGINLDKAFDNLFKENARHMTNDKYNLDLVDFDTSTDDFWQMPIIENDGFIPDSLIGFNYAKSNKEKNVGIHFYIDDYQFERLWNNPEEYIDILKEYECILSPDFSLYMDMPMPMKIWNIYRSRQIGQYYQQQGINVIPTISWAERETFEFCFKGIPKGSIVSISTIGVKKNKDALEIWKNGVDAMIAEIQPSAILVYGGELDYDYGDIEVRYYENQVTENMKKIKDKKKE